MHCLWQLAVIRTTGNQCWIARLVFAQGEFEPPNQPRGLLPPDLAPPASETDQSSQENAKLGQGVRGGPLPSTAPKLGESQPKQVWT